MRFSRKTASDRVVPKPAEVGVHYIAYTYVKNLLGLWH